MRDDDDSAARNRRLLDMIRRLHKWRGVPLPRLLRHTSAWSAGLAGIVLAFLAFMALERHEASPPPASDPEEPHVMVVGGAAASEVTVGDAMKVTVIEAISGPEQKLLDDGTLVTMPRGAKLGVQFTPNQRKVHLMKKDALFDVAKDPSRPFMVSAGDITATAVGTQFRVISGACVEVQVIEGRVRISVRGARPGAPSTKLNAGDTFNWPVGCAE